MIKHIIMFKLKEEANGKTAKVHPVHKSFGAYITQIRESRACIDYEY